MPGGRVTSVARDPVLRDDPNLPSLGMAWSRQRLLEFLNREVTPARSVAQATELKIEHMAYTAGRKCVVLCSLYSSDPLQPARRAVVTFVRDHSLEEVYLRHYHRTVDERPDGAAVYLPEHRCLVEFFPLDWQLPALPKALDPREVASLIGRSDHPASAAAERQANAEVLRYRPHETCVIAYRFAPTEIEGHEAVVGKLYAKEARGPGVWRALNVLYPQTARLRVGIPRPLALAREWNLVLMERVPGVSMNRLLKKVSTERQLKEAIKTTAIALTDFHRLNFDGDGMRSFAADMDKLRKRAARLHYVTPSLAREVDGLLNRVEPHGLNCAFAPTLIHGDFKPGQLLIQDGRGSLVDFDRTSLGDPAIDVGSFMAQLRQGALLRGEDTARCMSSYFLTEYQEHSRIKGLDHRARIFEAMSLIRIAVRKFEASPPSYARTGESSSEVLLLKEAAECLAQL